MDRSRDGAYPQLLIPRSKHRCRRWRSNPSGKFPQERLTRGTVTRTIRPAGRARRGAGAGCSAMKYQPLRSARRAASEAVPGGLVFKARRLLYHNKAEEEEQQAAASAFLNAFSPLLQARAASDLNGVEEQASAARGLLRNVLWKERSKGARRLFSSLWLRRVKIRV